MVFILTKYLVTAGVIVIVSELAKRSDKLGALVAALPLVTILVLIWLQVEGQSPVKIANHAWYTFWYVIPTLPMFLLIPYLLPKFGFWVALALGIATTVIAFAAFGVLLKHFGIDLL